jgi:predicted component of type VI protein secretion system
MASLITAKGHEAPLFDGRNLVGSAADADVQIRAELGIAPRQLIIEKEGSEWMIEPLESDSFTAVNGSPLQSRRKLIDGAYLRAGNLEFRFHLAGTPAQELKAAAKSQAATVNKTAPQQLAAAQTKELKNHGTSRKIIVVATIFVLIVAATIGGFIAFVSKDSVTLQSNDRSQL